MKKLLAPLLVALLAGCATEAPPPPPVRAPVVRPRPVPPKPAVQPVRQGLEIDRSYSAKGQSSRVKFIVVHYTVSDTPRSIRTLTQDVVSSHYLVTNDANPAILALVDESRQANHAGVSTWKNYTLLNGSSIGIEIVNMGFTDGPTGRLYYPFPQAQIDKVIALIKDIAARHQIPPENILGHSDIAPNRKQDPGPMFPWVQLAQQGLVQWPDAGRVAAGRALYEQQLPDARWFQQKLAAHGYAVPQTGELDEQTRVVISAFQMKYRPQDFGGFPDAETAAMLEAMNPTPASALPMAPALVRPGPQPLFVTPARVIPSPLPSPVPAPAVPAPARVIPSPLPATTPAPVRVIPVPPVPPVPAMPAPATPSPAPAAPPAAPAPTVPAVVAPAPIAPAPVTPAPAAPSAAVTTAPVPAPLPPTQSLPPPEQPVPSPEAPAPVVPAPQPTRP